MQMPRAHRSASGRAAFRAASGLTLIEVLIVITVIVVLMGVSFPVIGAVKARSDRDATRSLAMGLAAAAAVYRDLQTVPLDGGTLLRRPWDVDLDGVIDGDRQRGWAPTGVTVPTWYRGPVIMLGLTLPPWAVDSQGRIQDRWKRPLHVLWSAKKGGPGGFCCYSLGPDGLDQTVPTLSDEGDDLRSWDEP